MLRFTPLVPTRIMLDSAFPKNRSRLGMHAPHDIRILISGNGFGILDSGQR